MNQKRTGIMKMTNTISKHTQAELRKAHMERDPLSDFDNTYEFYSKLMFVPNIEDHPEYDNNFTTTNLRSPFNEPELSRNILEALNILQKYNKKVLVEVLIGYTQQELTAEDGSVKIVRVPVYDKVEKLKPRYVKSHDYYLDKLRALIISSKARDGFTVREFNKRKIETSESIEDKTNTNHNIFGFSKMNKTRD
jgi:hypothetical protein